MTVISSTYPFIVYFYVQQATLPMRHFPGWIRPSQSSKVQNKRFNTCTFQMKQNLCVTRKVFQKKKLPTATKEKWKQVKRCEQNVCKLISREAL